MTSTLRRHLLPLFVVLLAGLLVRLAWVAAVRPDPDDGRFDDTIWYYSTARFFAAGDGYVNAFTGTPTAAWPPGYTVFLGSLFRLFGEGFWTVATSNITLSLLTVAVTYAIALRLFDRTTALVAAAALALWPGQVYFTSLALSEPLFSLLFALAVLLLLCIATTQETRARGALIVSFGLTLALAALTRGQALVLLPVAIVVWRLSGHAWRPAIGWGMLAAAVTALAITPWAARNASVLGSPVLISTNAGANLWIGNHAGASGRMEIEEREPPQPERGDMTQGEYEAAADRLALRKGLAYMFSHPRHELELAGVKIRALYESDATGLDWNAGYRDGFYATEITESGLRALANGWWFAALALAGAGMIASRGMVRGPLAALPLLVLAWTAQHVLFFGEPRFHYPIVFAIAVLSARGAVVIFEALRRPLPRPGRRYAEA